MNVAQLSSDASGTQLQSTGTHRVKQLSSNDFIKLMLTQLQHQDPTQPTNSDQLLSQISQIGQLQASTELQSSLTGLVAQNQIGSAGNLIGKTVKGLDSQNKDVSGVVNSVRVQGSNVFLELDNSKELPLGNVTSISSAPVAGATGGSTSNIAKAA